MNTSKIFLLSPFVTSTLQAVANSHSDRGAAMQTRSVQARRCLGGTESN